MVRENGVFDARKIWNRRRLTFELTCTLWWANFGLEFLPKIGPPQSVRLSDGLGVFGKGKEICDMRVKLFFCPSRIWSAGRRVIKNIGGAQCVRNCAFAMMLQYAPLCLEAAPIAAQMRSEQGNSASNVLAYPGNGSYGVVSPMLGGGRDGGNSQVNGGAEVGRGVSIPLNGVAPIGPTVVEPLSSAADDKKRQKSDGPALGVRQMGKPEDHLWFWLLGGFITLFLPILTTPRRKSKTPNV